MENVWHLRKVADTAAKACFVCYRPSTSVLITPDSKDFFYICPSHLRDRNFAVPTDDETKALAERKKKDELDAEIAKVRRDYDERQKDKKKKKKDKAKKDGDAEKTDKHAASDDKDEQERDDKIKALTDKSAAAAATAVASKPDDGPRIFQLQKQFYQIRLEKLRGAEQAKRNRERLRNPTTFPSVPSGDL